MPLDRFVLILVVVVAAAAATVFLATLLFGTLIAPGAGLAVAVPVALVGYVIWRVIADRVTEAKDDPYDKMEH